LGWMSEDYEFAEVKRGNRRRIDSGGYIAAWLLVLRVARWIRLRAVVAVVVVRSFGAALLLALVLVSHLLNVIYN
jgi:hypothetical protein